MSNSVKISLTVGFISLVATLVSILIIKPKFLLQIKDDKKLNILKSSILLVLISSFFMVASFLLIDKEFGGTTFGFY
jgi:hypothetical protein